jgi:hypothetical protein
MRRLYYIAEDVETTRRVSDALHGDGITDHDFHVVARDEAGLYTHHVHSATTYQQVDIIHTGERFAMVGACAGLLLVWCLEVVAPFGFAPDLFSGLALVVLGTLFGAWQGGMIGLTREHYKLAPYHHDLEAGRYVIMVDVRGDREDDVRDLMRARFPEVCAAGDDSTLDNPFETPERIYHQNTH